MVSKLIRHLLNSKLSKHPFCLGGLGVPRSNKCHRFNVQGATGQMVYEELNIH